jgi:hypothetical protein
MTVQRDSGVIELRFICTESTPSRSGDSPRPTPQSSYSYTDRKIPEVTGRGEAHPAELAEEPGQVGAVWV